MQRDNKSYYDEFSAWYERERHQGYHAFLDEMEIDVVRRYLRPQMKILEAGCGTGLILRALRPLVTHAVGVDLSSGMLRTAARRRLQVLQANLTQLPFGDGSFDLVCSFKVLAHVQPIVPALAELSRVLRPGGILVGEFYNPHSLRYVIKRLKPPTPIAHGVSDEAVYTRYDTLEEVRSYLPPEMSIEAIYGLRVVTPFSQVHRVPFLGPMIRMLERRASEMRGLNRIGGFLVVVARKRQVETD